MLKTKFLKKVSQYVLSGLLVSTGLGYINYINSNNISNIFISNSYAVENLGSEKILKIKEQQDPSKFMKEVGENLFAKLKNNAKDIQKNPNLLKNIVKDDLMPFVHVKYSGSVILGKHYKSISIEDRELFFENLEKYLVVSYAQIFTLYENQTIKYLPIKDNKGDIVRSNIEVYQKGNQNPIKIQFSLRKNSKTKEWQIFDIVSEGVSFIQSKQIEWANYFFKKDINSLNKYLEQASKANIIFNNK